VRPRSVLAPHGVPDPLATRSVRAAAREAAVRAGAPLRVLFAGRFEARKGFDIAARVAADLLDRSQAIEIWFAGQALTEPLRRELADAGLPDREEGGRIRFLGELERSALEDAFVDCDLLLAPSRFESFGLVGIEAMSSRRLVLALDVGGLAEIIEPGVTGLTFPERAEVARDIADAILALDADRARLLEMGRHARERYEASYTLEVMAAALEAVYGRVAALRRGAAA